MHFYDFHIIILRKESENTIIIHNGVIIKNSGHYKCTHPCIITAYRNTSLQSTCVVILCNLLFLSLQHPGQHHQKLCMEHCRQVPEIPRILKNAYIRDKNPYEYNDF
jgi:hypothetical protein